MLVHPNYIKIYINSCMSYGQKGGFMTCEMDLSKGMGNGIDTHTVSICKVYLSKYDVMVETPAPGSQIRIWILVTHLTARSMQD